MLRAEVKGCIFNLRVGWGVSQGHEENMIGDTPYAEQVGYPTKLTNLDLHPGHCIPFYPQGPHMYSGDERDVFSVSRMHR